METLILWFAVICVFAIAVIFPLWMLGGDLAKKLFVHIIDFFKEKTEAILGKLDNESDLNQEVGFAPLGNATIAKEERNFELIDWWEQKFEAEMGASQHREEYFRLKGEENKLNVQINKKQDSINNSTGTAYQLSRQRDELREELMEVTKEMVIAALKWSRAMKLPDGSVPKPFHYKRTVAMPALQRQESPALPSGQFSVASFDNRIAELVKASKENLGLELGDGTPNNYEEYLSNKAAKAKGKAYTIADLDERPLRTQSEILNENPLRSHADMMMEDKERELQDAIATMAMLASSSKRKVKY